MKCDLLRIVAGIFRADSHASGHTRGPARENCKFEGVCIRLKFVRTKPSDKINGKSVAHKTATALSPLRL